MEEKKQSIFRKKTIERISSPEQLTDYLHVTNPGIWAILIAVIVLMAGVFAWSCTGTLETRSPAKIMVSDHLADIVVNDGSKLKEGMQVRVASRYSRIASVAVDDYGRQVAVAELDLPNGGYDGYVVTEETHPIDFLMNSYD